MSRVVWMTPQSIHHEVCQMVEREREMGRLPIDQRLQAIVDGDPARFNWQWVSGVRMAAYGHAPYLLAMCNCERVYSADFIGGDSPPVSVVPDRYRPIEMHRSRFFFYGREVPIWFGQCRRCSVCYYNTPSTSLDGMRPGIPRKFRAGECGIAADLLEENGFAEIAEIVRTLETSPEAPVT